MDRGRLQAMTRSLAALGTRRGLVRGGLAALGLGAASLSEAGEGVAARRRGRRKRKRKRNKGGAGGGLGGANCDVCDDEDDCPFTSIQAAINAATAGSTITICEGTYKEDITITKDLSLVSEARPEAAEEVELEGTGDGSVVTVQAQVTATITASSPSQGMVIRDGAGTPIDGSRWGGGILNHGDLTVTNTVVENNEAEFGAGIFNDFGARLTLDNSRLQFNDATGKGDGGGILNLGEFHVNGSQIVENEAKNAGAIYNSGVLIISGRSVVLDNKVDFDGGGIVNDGGDITIDASTVSGNKAQGRGGGILNTADVLGTLTIQNNSEIGGNEAEQGGGIFNQQPATMTLIDSAVTNNEADDLGGGIFNGGGGVGLLSSTVFENAAGDTGGGIFNTQGGVVTLDAQSAVVDNEPNNCVGTNTCGV